MIQLLKCRRMRKLLALWVGNDLDASQQFSARRHLVECPPCRDYWQQLQATQKVIEMGRSAPEDTEQRSLWPALQLQLAAPMPASMWRQQQGWIPTGALAAACLAVWFAAGNSPAFTQSGRVEQNWFHGSAALPARPTLGSKLEFDQFYDPRQPSDSSGSLRTPAVPVSETQFRSF